MIVCGVDFETSGLDPVKDRIVEVGAVLYDWNTGIPLILQSNLVRVEVPLSPEVTAVHGITDDMLELYGMPEPFVFGQLLALIDRSSYVMAHFGNDFDRKFCFETFTRLGIPVPAQNWLDTSCDVIYPEGVTTRNLGYLAAEAGFLNPFRHRAVFDVLTMLKVASEHPLERIIARSLEPMVYVQAYVSFAENQKAKDFSFRWHPETKMWWKGQKKSDFEAERDGYQFKWALMSGAPE